MKRRMFIAVLGAAAAWPAFASAQQSTMLTIGFMHARSREDTKHLVAAFKRALDENGFEEGKTLNVEWRFAAGQYDQLPQMASDLVSRRVALIVAGSDPAALAAKEATSSIPIVFVVGNDPVKLKLVGSMNEPEGNATGISILTASLEPKRLGLFRDLLGPDRSFAVLLNPKLAPVQFQFRDIVSAAKAIGWQTRVFWAATDTEMNKALEEIEAEQVSALEVGPDPFFDTRREKLASWAIQKKIPTMFQFREYALAGGLMSYGIDLADAYRQVGLYVARILKGGKPNDLPVLQPTKFQFVINMQTAKALGLTIPSGLLSIADEVIE
jgi:putative tryptophan/tyrosine transport system substrate-binding protein